ncbi:pentatricopeptide repeat-containing protein At1g73710 [Typha latifolia]|uniref:pentatricopeptide repeat-containing protein At1g73710 n=1 Tax=Typha latifolia TaxID=4733 RepID=UPI003C2E7037
MLNSSDCFRSLVPRNPSTIVVLTTPKLLSLRSRGCWKAQNQIFLRNLIQGSAKNGGFCLQSRVECTNSESKVETKQLNNWGSYGGCIPAILEALESVQDLDEALNPWKERLNNKERTIILKEQTDWRRALEIFNWFKRKGCYELNVIHYNVMLRILGRARRWGLVGSLWSEMKSDGLIPTNSTYGTLINAYCKGGLNRESLIWLGDMYKQGMMPDEVTVGIILQVYKKAGEFGKAELFFKRWSSDMNGGPETQKSYSLYTYNTLIDTYGKAGQLTKASETFAQMLREGIIPDIVTFNTMIHICGNDGRLEEVASLMAMMDELRCLPDTRTYNILISLYIKGDDVGEAEICFSKIKAAGLVPDIVSYRTLLYAYSIRNMVEKAEALVREVEDQGLVIDEYTQSALIRMYLSAGLLEKSWSWFEKFHDKMSSECFSANIDAFGEHGHLSLAEKAFSCCLDRQKLSVIVFNVMIKVYGLGKMYDRACELFDNMEKYGISPDSCSYNSLIQILSAAELPKKAISYVRKMQEVCLVNDCVPYSLVISSLAKLGELQLAEDLFKEMVSFRIQGDIVLYSILINAYAEVGDVQRAVKYVELMKRAGFGINSIICNSLIKLYTKVGYLREAQETYEIFKSLNDSQDVYSSNCMINLYNDYSMVKEAEEIFENLKLNGKANEFAYAMMMCLYKKVGRVDDTYRICQEMQDLGLVTDTLSYNSVIGLYASDGRMKEAVITFQHMIASGVPPNDATFRTLSTVLLKRGVSKDAIELLELMRRNDAQVGLHEWLKAINSIVRLDDSALQLGVNLRGHIKTGPSAIDTVKPEQGIMQESVALRQCSYG